MTKNNNLPAKGLHGELPPLLLLAVLAILFWRGFIPGYVHFANDGPLGQQNVHWQEMPGALTGMWDDLNDVGFPAGSFTPSIRAILFWGLGPVGYSKFYSPVSLFILGLGVWAFLRSLKLSSLAVTLGTLATVLNTIFFAGACWGIASVEIAMGMNFFALALICANHATTPWLTRWVRYGLAGFCVGMNVVEGADVGALCSMLVALFAFFKSLIETEGAWPAKVARGLGRVGVIALFAGFLATQTVASLIGTSIQGIAGTGQDSETKAAHWDWATQWSLPKRETLALVVPGLFGYKMDTPKDMMPLFKKYYEGGAYWGGGGRDPANDRYFDSGGKDSPPNPQWMRQTGGGNYVGIFVCLIAAWAVALAFRKQNSPFSGFQQKIICFWLVVLVGSLFLAWGRFAPFSETSDGFLFYALLYKLPYFSTIRNPGKFIIFFCWALTVLFAYGVHTLSALQTTGAAAKSVGPLAQFQNWWARAGAFDRKWTYFCGALLAASVLGWLIFSGEQKTFIAYLQKVGFGDENLAQEIAQFSLAQAAWFIPLLAAAIILILLTIAGYFSGSRARLGAWLFGAFLIFDLVRADLPYVIHWNYKYKYEVGSLNPVLQKLRETATEWRVAAAPEPRQSPPLRGYNNYFGGNGIYRIEWMQHHFPYYNIPSLDWIQMPRLPEDLKAYVTALSPDGTPEGLQKMTRRWELSSTRYLLGPAGFLPVLNQQLDPAKQRFRIAQRFDIIAKPEVTEVHQLEDLTATTNSDGELALIEFTGALPRAKLFANWQVSTNDAANLNTLADVHFDPAKTVLISTPEKNLPLISTNDTNAGTVDFKSYSTKKLVLAANAAAPAVLLLNDKYDPNWRVTVDGQPADLLRCNYFMRGVQLTPGAHTVEFDYNLPNSTLKITALAIVLALLLCGLLLVLPREVKKTE